METCQFSAHWGHFNRGIAPAFASKSRELTWNPHTVRKKTGYNQSISPKPKYKRVPLPYCPPPDKTSPPPPFALAPYPIIKLQLYQLLSTMKCLPYTINLSKVICHILSIFLHVFLHEKKLQIGRDVSDVSTNYPTVHLGTCNQSTSRISRPGQRLGQGQS